MEHQNILKEKMRKTQNWKVKHVHTANFSFKNLCQKHLIIENSNIKTFIIMGKPTWIEKSQLDQNVSTISLYFNTKQKRKEKCNSYYWYYDKLEINFLSKSWGIFGIVFCIQSCGFKDENKNCFLLFLENKNLKIYFRERRSWENEKTSKKVVNRIF